MSLDPPSPEAVAALAPTGVLRAGINMSNFLLVNGVGPDGAPSGVSPSMAAALADALSVPLQLVTFPDPGALVDALAAEELDVGNVGADPTRAKHLVFTNPYSEIEATYLVRSDSPITTLDEVDRPGACIVSRARAAYTLWLERNIAQAELVLADSLDASFEVFRDEGYEVLAGLRPRLLDDADRLPGSRLLEGRFTTVQQAIGTHRDRPPTGLSYLEVFVGWALASGFVARMIDEHSVRGLTVPEHDID
jgi:polar amino acid transport system substrate-binding protein